MVRYKKDRRTAPLCRFADLSGINRFDCRGRGFYIKESVLMEYKDERGRDEQKRRERIEVDRVKQGIDKNIYAEEKKNEKVLKPVTFSDKLKNFWYHYKGAVAVGTALVVIAGYFVHDLVTRPRYDALVTVASVKTLALYQETFENDFKAYAEDLNKDGTVKVGAAMAVLRPKGSPDEKNEYIIANKAKIAGILAASENIVFLLDDVGYNHIADVKSDAFMNLSEKYPGNKNVIKDRFFIKGSKFYKYLLEHGVEKSDISDNLSLCIRDVNTLSDDLHEKYGDKYQAQLKLVNSIINDK